MFDIRLLLFLSLFGGMAQTQDQANYKVSVKQTGSDAIGPLLRQAIEQKLKQKNRGTSFKLGKSDYVELLTMETDPSHPGEASFVSIIVSSMSPGGWPVPDQWYHKVLIVKKSEIAAVASLFMDDLSASLCNRLKSSLSPCPAEAPWIGFPQELPNRPKTQPKPAKNLDMSSSKRPPDL